MFFLFLSGPFHTTLDRFENSTLFLQLGLWFTLNPSEISYRIENGTTSRNTAIYIALSD